MVGIFLGLILILASGGCGFQPSKQVSKPPLRSYHLASDELSRPALAGSYIVTFRTAASSHQFGFANYLLEYQAHFAPLAEKFLGDPRVKDIQFLTKINLAKPDDLDWTAEFDPPPMLALLWKSSLENPKRIEGSITRVDFVDEASAASVLSEWDQQGAFWFAEPNYISQLSNSQNNLFQELSDQYSSLNYWWLERIGLTDAFATLARRDTSNSPTDDDIAASQPIVAVLDSGVDYNHPALASRIWTNSDKDLNLSSCENDVHGCNTTNSKRGRLGSGDVHPYGTSGPGQPCLGSDSNCSHGTHVAGLIVGDPNTTNDSGFSAAVAGTCPVCRVMILRIVGQVGKNSGILDSSIIAALKYIALFNRKGSPGVRVVNASFGKFVRSRSVGLLVRLLREKRQALVVAAAGNEDTLTMEYPAAFKDVIAVAAVDQQLRKETFSNFGRWVDIAAPGDYLLSSIPGGGTGSKSGTSMAAPLVAGVAGLMLARYPDISFEELRTSLLNAADPSFYRQDWIDGFNYHNYYPKIPQEELRQPLIGVGVLNANAAISKLTSEGLPVYSSLDRVRSGCGTINGFSIESHFAILLALLTTPLFLSVRSRYQSRHTRRMRLR